MMVYQFKFDDKIEDLKENLQRLTVGIPDMTTDEVPRCYQRHTVGVFGWFSRLLHRVAQAITCYHEHHQDWSTLIFTFYICTMKASKLQIFPYVYMNSKLFIVLNFEGTES